MSSLNRILTLAVVGVCAHTAAAQEQTLVGAGAMTHGGYGAPVVKFTSISGEGAVLTGGRGGWIINHTVVIGGGGYSLTTRVKSRVPGLFGERFVQFDYGGVTLEYILNSDRLVHASFEFLIGAGGIGHRHWTGDGWNDGYDGSRRDGVTVAEPGVTIDLNVTPWFRMSAGASYRFVSGANRGLATDGDLSAPALGLVFKFGKF